MYGFTYTTHGAMTAADLDEIRRDYDLDLCGCCESGNGAPGYDEDGWCVDCGCDRDEHA